MTREFELKREAKNLLLRFAIELEKISLKESIRDREKDSYLTTSMITVDNWKRVEGNRNIHKSNPRMEMTSMMTVESSRDERRATHISREYCFVRIHGESTRTENEVIELGM